MPQTINGLYKSELIYNERFGPCRTIEDVELATLSWVHWWNTQRLLEPIGNVPPIEYERSWAAARGSDGATNQSPEKRDADSLVASIT